MYLKVTKIVPIFKPSKLFSLSIDTDIIYSLFCGQSVAEKNDTLWLSLVRVLSHLLRMPSSAVFFLDFDALKKTCSSHGLQFTKRAHILPGFKCLQILGVKSKDEKEKQKQRAILESGTAATKNIDYYKSIELAYGSKETLARRLKDAQHKLNTFLQLKPMRVKDSIFWLSNYVTSFFVKFFLFA